MPVNQSKPPPKFPVPWGLFVILFVYCLGVGIYIWQEYYESPEYHAATFSDHAIAILGVDDGRTATREELLRAFDDFLEAGRLMPQEVQFAEALERLRGRFEERHFKLDIERIRRAEAISALTQRSEEQRAPLLVVGARNRGWAPDQLVVGPKTIVLWSIPGAVVIILVWAYLYVTAYLVRSRERETHLKSIEANVKELGKSKRRPRPR